MYVRCKEVLPARFGLGETHQAFYEAGLGRGSRREGFSFPKIGQHYVVYTVRIVSGYPYFFIGHHARPQDWATLPAPCFEILDRRVSKYWHLREIFSAPIGEAPEPGHPNVSSVSHLGVFITFAFREWIEEKGFANNLFELEDREVEIMSHYAALMDIEYRQTAITAQATRLSDRYLKCPECGHEWEVDRSNEMARCPSCSLVMHY